MFQSDEEPAVEATENTEVNTSEPAGDEPVEAAPAVFDWNGELEALSKAEWFSKIGDESLRNTLVRGFESKYKNFERGFTKAFQDTAARRKELERREAAIKDNELKVMRWLQGSGDPMAEKQAEIESLRQQHEAAMQSLRAEYEQSVKKAEEEWTGKYGSAEQERDALRAQLQQFEEAAREAEEQQVNQAVDEVETWLKSEAADVYENDDAFYAFCVLVTGGLDPEDAITMTRAKFGPPPAPTPEPVPEAMQMMNLGPGRSVGTTQSENRSYKDIMDAMRRAAQADESAFYNPRR